MPSNPVLIAAVACLVLLVGLLVLAQRRRGAARRKLPTEWALILRPVFSGEERRFHRQLCAAFPQHQVMAKLPLVRFCQPVRPREVRYWYELLGTLHVTFAVSSVNGRVLLALDVENERQPSRRGIQIKQSVLAACGVRYLRCPPEQLPSVPELQRLLPDDDRPAPQAPSPVAETRERLASTVASRRQARAQWQDSMQPTDSTFGSIDPADAPIGRHDPEPDLGGVVVDPPSPGLRH